MKYNNYLVILTALLSMSSCASILNPLKQKVNIAIPEGASFTVDGYKPLEKNGKYLIYRDAEAKQIEISKPGSKSENHVILQDKKSPLTFFSLVPFGVLIGPPLYDNFGKSRNYRYKNDFTDSLKVKPDINFNLTFDTLIVKKLKAYSDMPYRKYVKATTKGLTQKKRNKYKVLDGKKFNKESLFLYNLPDYFVTNQCSSYFFIYCH